MKNFVFEISRIKSTDLYQPRPDIETIVVSVLAEVENDARDTLENFGIHAYSPDCKLLNK
jgi:hypothetical protein